MCIPKPDNLGLMFEASIFCGGENILLGIIPVKCNNIIIYFFNLKLDSKNLILKSSKGALLHLQV